MQVPELFQKRGMLWHFEPFLTLETSKECIHELFKDRSEGRLLHDPHL